MSKILDRTDEINYNTYGTKMKIIKYNTARDIIVEFQDEHKAKVHTAYTPFSIGQVKNPYDKSVYGVGYKGNTKTELSMNNISCRYWKNMMKRCYCNKSLKTSPTYKDCTVCEEWHCFANFEKWFDENYYEIDNETMCLDKDILVKGNKIYSPETCTFVPQRINTLFCKSDSIRGKYQIGVSFDNKQNSFMSYMTVDNNFKFLGYYNNEQDAFNTYKKAKEKYIKKIAEQYKEYIPQKLYEAMYKWKVEETD